MNTDVIFLTTMMDILTDPIPAPFADEFPSGWRVKKKKKKRRRRRRKKKEKSRSRV